MKLPTIAFAAACATLALLPGCANGPITRTNASLSSASEIARESREALRTLYAQNPAARALGRRAKAVLVFPAVVKGGLVVGAQAGNGALILNNGEIGGFYQSVAASYGLQAGVQKFSYALFLMDDAAMRKLQTSAGWELGTTPNIVVVDRGAAATLSTTTVNRGIYAFFFHQRGLMGGLALQGTKITRINPNG